MSEVLPFEPHEVTDEDIRWASRLLGLPENAFYGEDATDPRQAVLKSIRTIDVAACPGSGKTTLLVAKLAILAEKWRYRTRGICVLSHTNAARHEIESRLGNTTAGRQLLSYPHFIGTIHAFVNEFLSLPWLRAKGYPIKIVDDVTVEKQRRSLLENSRQFSRLRMYLRKQEQYQNLVAKLTVSSPGFCVSKTNGQPVFKNPCTSKSQLEELAKKVVFMGYHRYDEMFMWAGDLIDNVPSVIGVLRDRFPLLLIDEAQDNSEEQSRILHRIFIDGNVPVIRQRFGDANQAIFGFVGGEGATTDEFPDSAVKRDIPNSHRFGQKIADLADPLGIIPYLLKGHGPKKPFVSGAADGPNTIFLFDDNSVSNVMDAYAELLLETFSDQELREGTFTAVGQVHRPPDKEEEKKFPHHVGHYWPEYDPELTRRDPKPQTFVQYILAGVGKAKVIGEAFPAVEKIAEGLLQLAGMAESETTIRNRRHKHRYVLELVDDCADVRERYKDLIAKFTVEGEVLTKETWDNRWCGVVRQIAETIAGGFQRSADIRSFLEWRAGPVALVALSSTQASRDNVYRFLKDGREVAIRVGSVHSVKGETHTATLVLETFWQDNRGRHNLELLLPWMRGSKSGKSGNGVYQPYRLKLHYVAMTRPTHLLCLAMKRSSLETEPGTLNKNAIETLRQRGWQTKFLCHSKSSESSHGDT